MDYVTLLAAAVAAAKKVERVVEIRPVENGLVYVNQKGVERFVEVARPVVQPKEEYDDTELRQEVADAIVQSIVPVNSRLDEQQVTVEAVQASLSGFQQDLGEDITFRTNTLLDGLRRLKTDIDGKSDQDHTHEQYLTEQDVLDLIPSDQWIRDDLELANKRVDLTNQNLENFRVDVDEQIDSLSKDVDAKSDEGHKHPEYVVYSELERRLAESGYDDDVIRKRLGSIQDDLNALSRTSSERVDHIVDRLLAEMDRRFDEKAHKNHSHTEFSEIAGELYELTRDKADRTHTHDQYLTRTDIEQLLPEVPAGVESAKVERNHLILYLTDGTRIDAGRVKPAMFGGGGGSKGADGKSAYEIWLDLGNTGTEQDFIDAISTGGTVSNWVYIGEPTSYTENPAIVFEPTTIDGVEVYQMGVYEP